MMTKSDSLLTMHMPKWEADNWQEALDNIRAVARIEGWCAGIEAAARTVEEASAPYTMHTNTGAMMFRACTEKLANAIRAIPPNLSVKD